ncbi:MAG: ATP-binding protein [Methylococcales bacterium]
MNPRRAARTPDRSVEIEIRNHGQGIPDYARDKIIDLFYSLKRPDSGKKRSRLGLSQVKVIVDVHQASIQVDNHPDGGVLARVVLPAGSFN